MKSVSRNYEGPAVIGGLSLAKVRIQDGVEESDSPWVSPGEPSVQVRWWEGEAGGDDPGILRAVLALPDSPVDVVLPVGRAVAYLTIDVAQYVEQVDPEWRISLQGAGPSPLG